MSTYSQHHSFDIALAAMYGVECAILIHHFQHWIRINRFAKRNIKEGHCWTYQTRKEIQAHFPYWSFDEIRRLCEKLVEIGVLITNNFNKSKVDKTLWYAFANEEAFGVDDESSNKFYERQNCLSKGKIATPIPDTKTTDIEEKKNKSASPPASAEAESLSNFFLEKIKERNPGFKDPKISKWITEFDCIMRLDKRSPVDLKAMIEWIHTNSFWQSICLSPSSLRKNFDKIIMQMKSKIGIPQSKTNQEWARQVVEKFRDRNDMHVGPKGLSFSIGESHLLIEFSENAFKEQVLSRLQKMNLNVNGL